MLFIGATGFLGSHILYEFLSNTDVEIYAIIRGQSKESAGKRLRETLEFFDKYNPAWEQRIHVVVGDASIPKFGLEEETYEILRSKVDCIFNCAAIVSHLGLYEVMYKSNVLTCSNILKFAEKKKNIKIFHISNLNNETYHIENTELLSFTHMGKMIQKYGENVVLRPYEDMWDYFLPIYEEGTDNSKMQEINNLIAYIDFLPWHMPTMFRFVKDKTKILLEKMGFAWKEPDQEIIDNLLDYGKQVGFFD